MRRPHSYKTLVAKEIPRNEVKSVEFKNKGKALEVKLKNKEKYEIGYIEQDDARTDQGAAKAAGAERTTSNRKRAACCCAC